MRNQLVFLTLDLCPVGTEGGEIIKSLFLLLYSLKIMSNIEKVNIKSYSLALPVRKQRSVRLR